MKTIKGIILIMAVIVLLVGQAWAAGSVTQTLDKYPNVNMRVLTFSWVGAAAGGAVTPVATTAAITEDIAGWYVYAIETNPGAGPPSIAYDITINDAEGLDIAGGTLADRSATSTQKVTPCLDTAHSIYGGVLIDGALTLTITNQIVNSAAGTVKLILAQ